MCLKNLTSSNALQSIMDKLQNAWQYSIPSLAHLLSHTLKYTGVSKIPKKPVYSKMNEKSTEK